jgi:hypothetical protein
MLLPYNSSLSIHELRSPVVVGTPLVVMIPSGVKPTITLIPGAGGTALLEYTTTSHQSLASATWVASSEGAVTVPFIQAAYGNLTAVRITASVSDAIVEVLG